METGLICHSRNFLSGISNTALARDYPIGRKELLAIYFENNIIGVRFLGDFK